MPTITLDGLDQAQHNTMRKPIDPIVLMFNLADPFLHLYMKSFSRSKIVIGVVKERTLNFRLIGNKKFWRVRVQN